MHHPWNGLDESPESTLAPHVLSTVKPWNSGASVCGGPIGRFFESAVAPDVLGQGLCVVDVFEALTDRVVAEPLADRLRRMPAMDELRASGSQLFLREHWSFLASGVGRCTFPPRAGVCRWRIPSILQSRA